MGGGAEGVRGRVIGKLDGCWREGILCWDAVRRLDYFSISAFPVPGTLAITMSFPATIVPSRAFTV